jgi:hypothetical protein
VRFVSNDPVNKILQLGGHTLIRCMDECQLCIEYSEGDSVALPSMTISECTFLLQESSKMIKILCQMGKDFVLVQQNGMHNNCIVIPCMYRSTLATLTHVHRII